MSAACDILILGDVHGEFGKLNTLLNKKRPGIVLQCGDFGFWPNMKEKDRRGRWSERKVPIVKDARLYWADGNHEDHWSLKARETNEVYQNVFHMRRGATLTLSDGRTVLFMGGANSVDREWRTPGYDWFPDEAITVQDVEGLPEVKVDIVISHTCPREFAILGDDMRLSDSSRLALSYVLRKYNPSLWYFGHFHYHQTGETRGCRWTGLTMAGAPHWWEWLPSLKGHGFIGRGR